jgi:hypothetical protein
VESRKWTAPCRLPGRPDDTWPHLRFPVGADDGNRTRIASLEGVWRTAVRTVELETLMLVSSRGYPLLTMVNGLLMA